MIAADDPKIVETELQPIPSTQCRGSSGRSVWTETGKFQFHLFRESESVSLVRPRTHKTLLSKGLSPYELFLSAKTGV